MTVSTVENRIEQRIEAERAADEHLAKQREAAGRASFNESARFAARNLEKKLQADLCIFNDYDQLTRHTVCQFIQSAPSRADLQPGSLRTRKWSAVCRRMVALLDAFDEWSAAQPPEA